MSDNNEDKLESKKKELPGTLDDLRNLRKFWEHHKVPLPEGEMEWVKKKCDDNNAELSYDDKLHVQYLIAYGHCSGIEIFQDAIFEKANENSKKIVYERQFELDLRKTLGDED